MNDTHSFRECLKGLFDQQHLGVLATYGDGYPYTSLVAFAATDDLDRLLFATTRATRKFANLSANPRVSMMIDNRSNRVEDFADAVAVTAMGEVFELMGQSLKEHKSLFLARHPHLSEFVAAPTCALLSIAVERYLMVSRFQNVNVLEMSP